MFVYLHCSLSKAPPVVVLILLASTCAYSQSTAILQGRVTAQHGDVVAAAKISVMDPATGVARTNLTLDDGLYQIAAIPIGHYRMAVEAAGFRTHVIEQLEVQVARTIVKDFQLTVGDVTEEVTVGSGGIAIERATSALGHVVNQLAIKVTF